jgi:hypothetical protein
MPRQWSRAEVEVTISDYFEMLRAERGSFEYNKAQHNRNLALLLENRTRGAIERKHQNISAILIELGHPYVDGYKPLGNYQDLLLQAVAARLVAERELLAQTKAEAEAPFALPTVDDILASLESPPERLEKRPYPDRTRSGLKIGARINYLELESNNSSLGAAGEEFVVHFEKARLISAGRADLAELVEHTSVELGDGAGYDIRSYEANGQDRFIEAKTTAYGKYTPFFVSRNEVQVSREKEAHYQLYRLFKFRREPKLFTLPGALDRTCTLDPVQFMASVA